MKYTIKSTSDTTRQVTVTLDAADLGPLDKKVLAKLAKQVKVAGFRPGKVPAHIAEKQLDANLVAQEVMEEAVNGTALDVFTEAKLTPLDRPQVDVKKYVPGQELEYVATVEVIPDIKLGDYKKLKAAKEKVSVTAKDVDDVIERIRASMSERVEVDRAAKLGDELNIDFVGTDKDGKEVAGATGKDYPLELGSNSFIPGFEDGLVGKKKGDKVDLALTFPKDYHHEPLKGAKVNFAVTVNAVKEVKLPELNDEFAAKAGPVKTIDELKTDVKRELTDQKEREAVDKLKDSLLEQLIKGSSIPTPEVLIADQMVSLERDFIQNLMYRGITLEAYLKQKGQSKEDWQKTELREQAIRRVQVGLALAELSKLENIEVSTEELEQRLESLFNSYQNDPEIRKQLDTPEARRDIANRVMTEKTVDRLVDLNTKV